MSGTQFIEEHEGMVYGLAHRLRRELSLRGEIDDLVAFGFGGLLEAERRFDPARGVRFRTFAYYRVRGAMLDGVRKMAHLPRRAHERHQSEDEVELTAAPMALDRAFTRISGSLTTGSVLQGELPEASPEAASWPGPRSPGARPPRCLGCMPRTTTTWRASASASWRRAASSCPNGFDRGTGSSDWPPPDPIPTATP